MASVADIKKRLQKNGITERTRDPYKTDSSKESGYVGSDAFQKIKERVKSSGVSFDINDDYINTFLSDANDFITTAKTDYEGIGWSNASSTYTARDEAWVDLSNRADYIGTWLKHNKDRLDPDTYNSLSNSLNSISSNMNPIMDGFRESRRFYSQWETEEDYNKAVEAQKEYDALLNFDLEAAEEEMKPFKMHKSILADSRDEITQLKNRNAQLELAIAKGGDDVVQGAYSAELEANKKKIEARQKDIDTVLGMYGSEANLDHIISQKEMPYNRAKRLQDSVALTEDAVNAPDFEAKSQYVSTKSGKWFPKLTTDYGLGYDDLAYEYINNVELDRITIEGKHFMYNTAPAADNESIYRQNGYDYMTPNEVKIYNYYYSTQGREKAEEYLDTIQETLNQRKGSAMFEKIEDKPFLEYMFGVEAGLDQFKSGMESLFSSEDYIPQSATQIASGMVREDLGDVGFNLPEWMGGSSIGQVGYDLTTTTSNMLPSILVSFVPGVGQVASPTLLGASAAGNAKAEMLRLGYSKEQANTYGILVGASEGLLQYALGGISSLGGKVSGNVISKMVSQIDNGLAKAAIKLGGNMVSEGLEEALQSILEPVFKSITTGEELEAVNWEEVIYSGLLGMMTAGAFEGTGAVANGVASGVDYLQQVKQHGQGIIDRGGVDSLKALAMDVAGANQNSLGKKVETLAGKVNHKASAMNVGKLSASIEKTMSSQDKADLTNALVKKGMSSKEAMLTAKYLMGEVELSEAQVAKIEGNADVIAVVDELMNKADSAINERARSLMVARRGNITKAKSVAPKATKSGDMDVKVEVNVDGKVSKSGKTTRKSTGEAVTINKDNAIAKVDDNGVVYFNTDQGEVAEADIEYANESEALVYEAFVDMTPGMANAIIKNYDGSVPAQTYIDGMREGVLLYGMHNFQAVGKDISNASTFAELSDTDQDFALKLGRAFAKTEAEAQEASIRKTTEKAEKSAPTKKTKGGRVSFEGGVKAKTKDQKKAVRLARYLSQAIGIDIVFYDARTTSNPYGKDSNGYYDKTTNSIHLDIQGAHNDTKTIAFTLSHEVVHFIKEWSPEKFNTFASFLMEQYAEHGVDTSTLLANKMAELKNTNADEVYEEMICDACETMLLDSNAMVKLMQLRQTDLTLFEKLKLHIMELLTALREAYRKLGYEATTDEAKALLKMTDVLDKLHTMFEEAAVEATLNYQAEMSLMEMEENTDIVPVESVVKHSYKSLAQAAGFEARENEDGTRSFVRDGNAVSKVTVEDIENSPIGAFINYSLEKNDIDKEQADRQKKMFADICTMACKTNDFSMTMQFVGSAVFTGMKANADKQYGTTYDFPSICTKTQAVIDAMSARMVKLGRGLNKKEILNLYNEVFNAGNPVPCPECYVFSRWIGIGGLLDNIKKYQDYYGKMSVTEVAEAYKKMRSEVEAFAEEQGLSFGKAKGALTAKLTKEYNKLTEKIEKATNQGEAVKKEDIKRLSELEPMMNTVKAMTWLENVYFADSALTKVNKNFRVPNEVLFDLNNGEAFASKYPEAWAFRTTQGAGYGKAITPYAEASLGEGILVTNNTTNAIKGKARGTLNNFFLQQRGQMDKQARKALDSARLKQKIQAFLGGQRFQSTSDARYENASDYLLAALEMQAMHGMVQVYTKVDGAVPTFEAWGFSTNQSLMPLGGGLDADGNIKDTHVGGMSTKIAETNRKKHEHAGTITIGVNDNHIRALFRQLIRDFIIPYHASGGDASLIAEFRTVQDIEAKKVARVRSTDYSRTQSDKVLSDEVLTWLGKTDAEIEQIHKVREARIAILTRGKVDMDVVRGNRFLSALYDKFHGGEWDGVKLAKSKIESQIYPNEFWDQSVSYEESGKISRDYLEYCEDLGFLHRFSGLVPSNGKLVPVNGYDENGNRVQLTDLAYKYENGVKTDVVENFYWKVLTDRRMYGNEGQYLPQKVVTLNDTAPDTVTSFAKNNFGRQYNREVSMATAQKVASEAWGNIVEDLGADNVAEVTEQYTDVENTARIKKQQKKTSDNTYEAIGKELLYYEEGDLAPDLTLVETVNDRTGNKEVTIKHYGQKPADYIPKKIAYCYKLFEQHPDGTLHALFAGATKSVPLNEWRYAQGFPRTDAGVKGMNLRERYGWHLSAGLPSAPHLMSSKDFNRGYPSKGAYGHPKGSKRVWVRMAYDASTDFNSIADSTGKQNDIYGLIPFGGYYAFKENNQSEWVISSAVKIDKILTEEERQQILKDAGYDEYEAWRLKYQPTPEERAERELANKERAKAKARAKKLGIDSELSESTKAMRDAIKSRIIDNPELTKGIKKQVKKNPSSYAPTFYSAMSRVVDDIKMDKIGATSLVPYLKGKGIKHDEIKWSGIEAWLEGKKSVTKAELQEFLAESSLEIQEQMSNKIPYDIIKDGNNYLVKHKNGIIIGTWEYTENPGDPDLVGWMSEDTGDIVTSVEELKSYVSDSYDDIGTRWGDYKLDGGSNYRELVFVMPNSSYSNQAMRVHWGQDAEGVLAHARIQDMTTSDGKKMLFVEEIQSDWHNEGHKSGYADDEMFAQRDALERKVQEAFLKLEDYSVAATGMAGEWETIERTPRGVKLLREYREAKAELEKADDVYLRAVNDAPFRDTYHEYVLKRLLRMAAEEGYDSLGWTPAEIQTERWSDEFAEGYRIEYDQDIPKFLRKYGKKWGATVGKERIGGFDEKIDVDINTPLDDDVWLLDEGVSFEGTEVWSMDITEAMEQSVLYEGQPKFQKKKLSNRTILANALETTIDTSTQEGKNARKWLKEYKSKIDFIEKEEARLAELKSEIYAISFTKGADRSKLTSLNEEKQKTANRIHTYDKQLTRLESMKPIKDVLERERERVRKRATEKGREAMRGYRDRLQTTEIRNKIKRFKKEMESTLQHPTDNKYIPLNLVQAMVDVCNLIDTDTPLYKADGSINKAQERRNATKERLQSLKDEYENLKTNADPMYSGEFDEVIYKYLGKLRTDFEGKSLNDMTRAELEEMYDILKSINGTILEARKLIGWGDASSVYEAGDTIVSEQEAITKSRKNEKRNVAQKARDWVVDMSLSPVRNIERMSGYREKSPLLKLFQDFERGVRKKNMFAMESYKSFEALTSGENAKKYEDAVYKDYGAEYTDVNGRKFKISKMQMMQAILSYEREQANKMHHIEGSGFTFADLNMLRKGKLKEAVSEEYSHRIPFATGMVEKFVEALAEDKWAQDYMEAARQFFNGKAKDAINETYIILKHRIIARDQNYIPFEVDKNFVVREISAENDIQQTINSYGMLKDTKVGASQPLIITGLNNILDRHIDQVGNVYGLAVAIRNFNKVWNVRSVASNFGGDPTVQAAIERNWGVGGKKFVTQTVQDLQGARPNNQSELYRKVKSGYIGATFVLNLSVVTKQIGSLYSATSMLKWRDPARMVANLVFTMANSKKISEEVDKYTATVWMRRQGLSDAELATLATQAKKPGISKAVGKLPTAFNPTKWITSMDAMVALSLWKYAKEDTAKRTGLSGEELMKATAEFYDSLVENTQSMTDVLHRPEIQKRSDVLSESFGMFKTDLYQMAGQLQTTAGRYQHSKTKENGAALARTALSITMSALWGSLMTSLFALLRYKVDPYRDDEDDELTVLSWLKKAIMGLLGDMAGYVMPLFGSEAVGVIETIMYGEADEAVDSLVLTAVNDLYSALLMVIDSFKEGEMPSADEWIKLATKSLQVFGVPANNIKRIIDAIRLHAKDIANEEFFSFEAGLDKPNSQRLYNAIISGDEDRIEKAKRKYKDQNAINRAIRDALRENDHRIQDAVIAHYSGDSKKRASISLEIESEGNFAPNIVRGAINNAITNLDTKVRSALDAKRMGKTAEHDKIVKELLKEYPKDFIEKMLGETILEEEEVTEDKLIGLFDMDDYYAALVGRDEATADEAKEDIIKTDVENGKNRDEAESDFNNRFATHLGDRYAEGEISDSEAQRMLVQYGGKSEEDAYSKVQWWAFKQEYTDYDDLSEDAVSKYYEEVEPYGIGISVYYDYKDRTSGIESDRDENGNPISGSKKAKLMQVINSLPITSSQKDALYYLNGWSEKTLGEAPWH